MTAYAIPRRPITAPVHKVKREKAPAHLDFIRTLPCAACGREGMTEAAHVRMASPEHGKGYTAKARKPDDRHANPLCNDCHRDQHSGAEDAWWATHGINPVTLAMLLHSASGDEAAARAILASARIVAPRTIDGRVVAR